MSLLHFISSRRSLLQGALAAGVAAGLPWSRVVAAAPSSPGGQAVPRVPFAHRGADLPSVDFARRATRIPDARAVQAVPGRSYPPFASRNDCLGAAIDLSRRLEQYVKDWLDGKVPAALPTDLLPTGINPVDHHNFVLQRVDQIVAEDQWGVRPAETIDFTGLRGYFPDPHCTYLVPTAFYAPFGSTVVIEGEFPHCRYFSIQPTPPFDPDVLRYSGYAGAPEVPLPDVDIEPLPGHVNPFRPGADRNATKRGYHVEIDLVVGNPTLVEPSFRGPYYRGAGNRRFGSALCYQGPWGTEEGGHKRGPFDVGQLWLRYYAPDHGRGPLAGVALPKLFYRLPDGRAYYIAAGKPGLADRANRRVPIRVTGSEEPRDIVGEKATWGWDKKFGILRSILVGVGSGLYLGPKWARDLDYHVTWRGEDEPGANRLEQSATTCSHINYFTRGIAVGWGKVAVVTGRLPRTPRTRGGEAVMNRGEARYFSLTSYDPAYPQADGYAGAAISSVMDDEIVTDAEGRYIICYSRPEDRPANATAANGVTWVNWGSVGSQAVTCRWLSVDPDWSFPLTPHEEFIGWEGSWASARFSPRFVGENHHRGRLLEYLPRIHYLTRVAFEALGGPLSIAQVPAWATPPVSRTVRGRVTAGGSGVAGVRISDGIHVAFSRADGTYELPTIAEALALGADHPQYLVTPSPRSVDTTSADAAGIDFTATARPEPATVLVEVDLSGRVGRDIITLTVGGQPVRPGTDGAWSARLTVPAGTTAVELIGRDALGGERVRTLTLTRPTAG